MAKLTNEQQVFLVSQFACYATLSQTLTAFEERFGFSILRTVANKYDMNGWAKEISGRKWLPIFDEARAKFLASIGDIPIAQRAFRLAQLGKMFDTAINAKNLGMAAQLLEQAAKEAGGSFTNERKVNGKVSVGIDDAEEITPEDRRIRLSQHLASALEAMKPETAH